MKDALADNPVKTQQTLRFTFGAPFAAASLLAVMLLLMILSGWHKNFSYDEPNNLRYGKNILLKGPLAETDGQRMPVFILHAIPCISYGCAAEEIADHPWHQLWIRLPSMIFTLTLGWLVWYWCRKLYGPHAALGALLLYVFNPTLLAHGKQITSDAITSFFVVLTVFLFWKWRSKKKEKYFYFTAIAAGVAIVTKFSSILLLGILPMIVITQKILARNFRPSWNGLGNILKKSTAFLFLIWLVINGAYLFQGSFESTRSYAWQSRFYQNIAKVDFPMPLPRIFVRGLDYSHYIEENDQFGRGNNYILGHRHRKGRDYAFLLMILFKSPLALLVILMAALASRQPAPGPASQDSPGPYLWIPFALWLLFFSSFCDVQVGIRYILPGYVFLILFAGKAFQNTKGKIKIALLGAVSLWYILSAVSYHPHYMSYFNELIGDRINAYKYLADSNLDWEDKSHYIKKWETDHPGIPYQTHSQAMTNPKPGFFLIPANAYVGVMDADQLAWIREFKPLAQITYSHYLLYVSAEELARALKKHPIPKVKP